MSTPGEHHTLVAPFTPGEVKALEAWQSSRNVHPYTHSHHGWEGTYNLIPTTQGWICPLPECTYTQNWCYTFSIGRDALGRIAPSVMVQIDILEG